MPVPHFNIKITQRSKGNSAVAGAAYQAGEKLFSEYDQKTKNYTCKKEVVYTEIMLPPNAPPEYADRATLWNSVEEIEKQWNSQLARRFVAALPREVPMELLPQMVKEYCEEQFVSKGMCCDFAIHDPDPPGHNPHCHFMLTMRAIDENGKWMPKSRKVYDLDENGERIKLPSGRWKSHKEDTVDWNEQYHAEEWRHGWEIVQNKYLELAGSPERIDMRSYERQGLDIIPTVHMGTAVSALERKGIATNIGNLNRDIKAANRMMNAIRSTIKSLRDWIADILEATKEVIAENEAEKKNASPNLAVLLRDYLNLRKAERSEWSRYGQQKGTTDDLKTISQATVYLQRHELFTLEDLDIALQGVSEKATAIREDMQKAANRMKAITAIQTAVADCEKHKAVHDKYIKIGWKIRKEAYVESHKDELTAFNKAYRILKKHGADLNVDLKALQKEYDGLRTTHADLKEQLAAVNEELKPMKDIRYWVSNAEYAKHDRAEFVRVVQEAQSSQQTAEVKKQRIRLATAKQRVSELEVLLCKIYEDNILGKLSDSRYATLDAQYEKEQSELTAEISALEKAVKSYEKHEKDADRFIALIDKYENFDKLTIAMLNEFIEKILVHERDRKGSIQTTQEVEIYFNFVGRFVPPAFGEVELTPEELEEIRKREERKDRLHQNYLKRKASGAQKRYEDKIKGRKKAEIEAKKAAIRAEDIAKGVFVPVSSLPQREPMKGVQTA